MSFTDPEKWLPRKILDKASIDCEYAWRISDIPEVIEAARAAETATSLTIAISGSGVFPDVND